MLKTVFHFFIMGVTVLVAANSSHAASFESLYGQLRPTAETALPSTVEPLAFVEDSDNQVATVSFLDYIAGGGKDGGKDGDGKGKGCGDGCVGNWRDNTVVFLASDAWTNIGDTATAGNAFGQSRVQSNFGFRTGFNTGVGLGNLPFRAQVGASYGAYDFKGRGNFPGAIDDTVEQQIFLTAGLYSRSDVCCGDRISWAIVYDHMYDDGWGTFANNNVNLGQVRGMFGYAWNECNEFGVWATTRAHQDTANVATPVATATIRAVDQVNAFWHHNYEFGGDTWLYLGTADSPSSWTLGLSAQAPLNDRAALFANCNYYVPGSATGSAGGTEEIWNVSLGVSWYLGGKASNGSVSGHKGLPLMPVANNGTFAVSN